MYLADRKAARSRVSKLKAELKKEQEELKELEKCHDEKGYGKGRSRGKGKGKGPAVSPALSAQRTKVAQLEASLTEAEGNITKGTLTPTTISRLQVCEIIRT